METLKDLERKLVPLRKGANRGNKPVWMLLKLVKRRHKIFRKCKDPHHPACMKANKQAQVQSAIVKKVLNSSWLPK